MKLRTDVLLRYDGKYVLCTCIGEICGPDEVNGDLTLHHDAAAAHALMQALNERRWQDTDDAVKRADELMREWGFTND